MNVGKIRGRRILQYYVHWQFELPAAQPILLAHPTVYKSACQLVSQRDYTGFCLYS